MRIVNPTNDNHFADIDEINEKFNKVIDGESVCDAPSYFRITEKAGERPHGQTVYVDRKNVNMGLLKKEDKSTHCPLKGDATYYSYNGREVAWSYETVLPSADALLDLISIY